MLFSVPWSRCELMEYRIYTHHYASRPHAERCRRRAAARVDQCDLIGCGAVAGSGRESLSEDNGGRAGADGALGRRLGAGEVRLIRRGRVAARQGVRVLACSPAVPPALELTLHAFLTARNGRRRWRRRCSWRGQLAPCCLR